jgi:hypothetical protein
MPQQSPGCLPRWILPGSGRAPCSHRRPGTGGRPRWSPARAPGTARAAGRPGRRLRGAEARMPGQHRESRANRGLRAQDHVPGGGAAGAAPGALRRQRPPRVGRGPRAGPGGGRPVPGAAVAVVGLEAQRLGVAPMQVTESAADGRFIATASLERDGAGVGGKAGYGGSKKIARQAPSPARRVRQGPHQVRHQPLRQHLVRDHLPGAEGATAAGSGAVPATGLEVAAGGGRAAPHAHPDRLGRAMIVALEQGEPVPERPGYHGGGACRGDAVRCRRG